MMRENIAQDVDQETCNIWLQKGNVFGTIDGFMVVIQYQTINTWWYSKYIIKDPNTST